MIHSRITSKSQTTVPLAIRRALGIAPGDDLLWELEGDKVVLRRVEGGPDVDGPLGDFSTFHEWFDELDAPFDAL